MRLVVLTLSFFTWSLIQAQDQARLDRANRLSVEGKYQQAIDLYQEVMNETSSCSECILGIAQAEIRIGQLDKSISRSMELIENSKDPLRVAEAKNLLGEAYLNKGRNDLALEKLEEALSDFQKLGNDKELDLANCYSNLALAYWNSGNEDLSLQYQLSVLDIRQRILGEDDIQVGDAYNNLGLIYPAERSEESLLQYERAYEIYQQNFGMSHPKVALALNNMAIIQRRLGNYLDASEKFEQSMEVWDGLYEGDHPNKAFVYLNIGLVYKEQEQLELALEYYDLALTMYQRLLGDRHPEIANVLTSIGSVLLQKGEYKASVVKFNQSINANLVDQTLTDIYQNPQLTNYYNPNILLTSLQLKARAFEALHYNKTLRPRDMKMALQTLELCDSLISELRRSRLNESDKIALGNIAKEVYEDAVRLNLAFSEVSISPNLYRRRAFDFAEKSKASVLLAAISDTKAKHFAGLPDDLLEAESKLKAEVAYYDHKVAETTGDEQDSFRVRLIEANQDYNSFIADLEEKYPRYFNLKYSNAQVTISELQNVLDGETGVLSYFKAERNNTLYAFLVTKDGFRFYEFDLQEDLNRWTRGLRNSIKLNLPEIYIESASALYSQLLPKKLPTDVTSLVIIPDGELSTIPFEVLLNESEIPEEVDFSKLPYLIKDYSLSYDFSATLFHQRQLTLKNSDQVESALLVAPIEFKGEEIFLATLPETGNEIRQLDVLFTTKKQRVKTLIQGDANESAVKNEDMMSYRYLHFATHGEINEADPRLSKIYLNPSDGNDGRLFSSEIYNLKINADLVTLSACETGLGKVTKGEGIIGLSRALMYAGAKNLIVSFWKVSDRSTSDLMIDFYRHHLKVSTYMDYNDALRRAKLNMISNHEFAAPYYWAPFILIGI